MIPVIRIYLLYLQTVLITARPGVTIINASKAPAKRSQHANTTCRNIVGRNMLHAFGHRVATFWVLLAQI